MKKVLFPIIGAIFLITTMAQAKDLPGLSATLERAVAKQPTPFSNTRVKQMCEEWPTCMEWVNNKIQQNPSFQVVDTEVERWVKGWRNGKTIWGYRFYTQTQENGQTKTYLFKRGNEGYSYTAPVVIKKFPGHPVPSNPTNHILFYASVANRDYNAYYHSLCHSWPGCEKLTKVYDLARVATSQYIYKWDAQGNALWKRKLYIAVGFFSDKTFSFQAYQTKVAGDYTYQAPVEINECPTPPDF